MKKQQSFYLEHIQAEVENITTFTKIGYDAYLGDIRTQHAIIRSFEIIGEAVKNLGPAFHQKYPSIDWQKIVDFRNKLTHEYFRIDLNKVWENATVKILALDVMVRQLLILYPPPAE